MFPRPRVSTPGALGQDTRRTQLKGLYSQFFLGLDEAKPQSVPQTQSSRPQRGGASADVWTSRVQPTSRHEYPAAVLRKPEALGKIVGYGGHRQGAAFITGETFTQEQLIVEKQTNRKGAGRREVTTYEPDKSFDKGRHRTYGDTTAADTTPWAPEVSYDHINPRIPGGLLRTARNSGGGGEGRAGGAQVLSPHIKRKQFPVYPITRGPTRFRVGGHDVFLVN